ncbi:MAG: hypothetical protein ACC628_14270 [Pirellulaceae bacterium]
MKTAHVPNGLLLVVLVMIGSASPLTAQALDVPMDRDLVSVVIRLGLKSAEPAVWEGTYELDKGRVLATAGWRFHENDFATTSEFHVSARRFYPRFWNRRGRDAHSLPIEPNGFVLTLADLAPKSVLSVKTSHGEFTVPVGKLTYGMPRTRLDGQVDYQRVPTSRQIVKAPTEDGYPSAAVGPEHQVGVAYIAFTHGVGFEKRPAIATDPEDYAFLAKPTGGDQLMYIELQDGAWSQPAPLTESGGDLFGTATAVDGQGRMWVFWAANENDNWDLFGRVRDEQKWSTPIRISSAPGSDFHHVATTDAEGRVWLAWQSFGDTHSNILAARQEGDGFSEPVLVSGSPANDWKPAIAASADGQVAVAWDTYAIGNYDVHLRTWKSGDWDDEQAVTGSLQNEARASLAFDPENRLWITYEVAPEGWGKDFGPYDQSPKRTALYRSRSIEVKVLAGGRFQTTKANVIRALPMPAGQTRFPKQGDAALLAGPTLAVDASGRIWLSVRVRMARFASDLGGTWVSFLTTLDDNAWRPAVMVPETDGFLHETAALVPAPDSGLLVVASTDGRFRAAAKFGLRARRGKRTPAANPPSTRTYATYADRIFNKEIAVADTGTLKKPEMAFQLQSAERVSATEPTQAAQKEAKEVAAMRDYRVEIGGKKLRPVRGEFHRHTEISSDGSGDGTIFDMWRYGIDMASLDWIGSGDHDNGSGRDFSWWFTQKTTSIFNVPGAFTPMYTYERSCSYPDGHRNAVFARRGIRPLNRLQGGKGKAMDELPPDAPRPKSPDTLMFYKYLRYFDGVCASHTSGTDMGTDWRDNDPKVEPIVEIYQGDRQNYERPGAPRSNTEQYSLGGWRPLGFVSMALKKGYRLGFQSSSDHISTHMSYCNVWVEEPTREAILEGMKLRRIYGSTDNIIADVRCGDHFMGEEFTVTKRPTLDIKLVGTAPFAEVVIVKDNEYVYTAQPNKRLVEFQWTDSAAKPGSTSYYYVRGTQVGQTTTRKVNASTGGKTEVELNNGEIVWVSPMWITYSE